MTPQQEFARVIVLIVLAALVIGLYLGYQIK